MSLRLLIPVVVLATGVVITAVWWGVTAYQSRTVAYPYAPLPVVPGVDKDTVISCLRDRRFRVNPQCLDHGSLKTGATIDAVSPDQRVNINFTFDSLGQINNVKYRVIADKATLTQLDALVMQRYEAAGWEKPPSQALRATLVHGHQRMLMYHLFECDPVYPKESYFFALELDKQL